MVSRRHAAIEWTPAGYRLVDQGSRNGTLVAERPVRDVALTPRLRFRIGQTVFEFDVPHGAAGDDDDDPTVRLPSFAPDETVEADAGVLLSGLPTVEAPASLERAGEAIEAAGKAILIDEGEFAYYVVWGKVELFTVGVEDRRPAGARRHFATIGPQEAFFGVDYRLARGLGFVAQWTAGTSVRRIARGELSRIAATTGGRVAVSRAIDAWIGRVSGCLARDTGVRPEVSAAVRAGESITLPAGTRARAGAGVVWLRLGAQELLFISTTTLGPDGGGRGNVFPLTTETWVESEGEAEARLVGGGPTEALLTAGEAWDSLDAFHAVAFECQLINRRLAVVDEFERLESKARQSEAAQEAAIDAIGSVLGGRHRMPGSRAAIGSVKPLLEACRLVGEPLGIAIASPGQSRGQRTLDEQVLATAAASRCRTRQVALRGEWWLSEHGPLLAFRAERDAPVALLPTGRHGYQLSDPAAGTTEAVTREVAFSLHPFAYSFYPSLPAGKLSGWDLVRFGSRGLARDLRTIVGMGLATGVLSITLPYLTGRVIDSAVPGADRLLLLQLGLGMALIAVATAAFKVTQSVAVVRVESRMDYALQAALWDRVLNLPAGFFRNYGAGDLAERVSGINAIRGVLCEAGVGGILAALSSLAYLVLMLGYNARLAAVATLLAVTLVLITTLGNLAQLRFRRGEITQRGKVASLVLQLVAGVSKVRVSAAENYAFRVWAEQFSTQKRARFKAGRVQNLVLTAVGGYQILSTLAIFGALAWLRSSGGAPGFTTGSFVAFFVAFAAFGAGLQSLSDASLGVLLVVPLFERLRPVLETLPESDPSKLAPGVLRGEIEVSHLFFRYAPEAPLVLEDVSFRVQPGEFVALVGASGCGKSTLLRLLLGFERPQAGEVRYDRQNLDDLDVRAVRQQFGVVLQESQVLPTDIYRNIVGTSARTLRDAWDAAEMAGLADDIRQMPMGMSTFVSEGGGTFSGGQKQRLLIARALVSRPRIIFFDEATSALDNRAQAVVSESMDRLEATRIVIAHRLSTIVNADRILYLEDGKVKEEGTYEQLMARDGGFAALAKRQIA